MLPVMLLRRASVMSYGGCPRLSAMYSSDVTDPDSLPLGPNDKVSPQMKNRNPMNLEKMRIGYKPVGFPTEDKKRNYWNALELSISGQHTTASVVHWTGRSVCSASTKEWAIQKFLYNKTDMAALKIVGKVLGQRCLETGLTEVSLQIKPKALEKEKMRIFVQSIKETGLALKESPQFLPNNPFRNLKQSRFETHIKPWEIIDE